MRASAVGFGLIVALGASACGGSAPLGRREVALREAGLGEAAMKRGHPVQAARRYDAALAEARALDDRALVARLLVDQAVALVRAGRCDLADVRAGEVMRSQDGPLRARAALVRASCARSADPAREALAVARAAAGKDGCLLATADCSEGALLAASEPGLAAERYRAAAGRACEQPDVVALCSYNEGRLAMRSAAPARAATAFARSADAAARAGDAAAVAAALHGEALARDADPAASADLARRAGHAAWSAGRYPLAAEAFALCARQFGRSGRDEEAGTCRDNGSRALGRIAPSPPADGGATAAPAAAP